LPVPAAAVSRRATTETIMSETRVGPSGLPAGVAPTVPVGDALDRWADCRLEVAPGGIGDRDERDLAHAVRDAEQLGGLALLRQVQRGPDRAQPARAEGQHEAPDARKDRSVEAGG